MRQLFRYDCQSHQRFTNLLSKRYFFSFSKSLMSCLSPPPSPPTHSTSVQFDQAKLRNRVLGNSGPCLKVWNADASLSPDASVTACVRNRIPAVFSFFFLVSSCCCCCCIYCCCSCCCCYYVTMLFRVQRIFTPIAITTRSTRTLRSTAERRREIEEEEGKRKRKPRIAKKIILFGACGRRSIRDEVSVFNRKLLIHHSIRR